jgi:hypothetical protein
MREILKTKLALLKTGLEAMQQQAQQVAANMSAQSGAIQIVEQLLTEVPPEAEPVATAAAEVDNFEHDAAPVE